MISRCRPDGWCDFFHPSVYDLTAHEAGQGGALGDRHNVVYLELHGRTFCPRARQPHPFNLPLESPANAALERRADDATLIFSILNGAQLPAGCVYTLFCSLTSHASRDTLPVQVDFTARELVNGSKVQMQLRSSGEGWLRSGWYDVFYEILDTYPGPEREEALLARRQHSLWVPAPPEEPQRRKAAEGEGMEASSQSAKVSHSGEGPKEKEGEGIRGEERRRATLDTEAETKHETNNGSARSDVRERNRGQLAQGVSSVEEDCGSNEQPFSSGLLDSPSLMLAREMTTGERRRAVEIIPDSGLRVSFSPHPIGTCYDTLHPHTIHTINIPAHTIHTINNSLLCINHQSPRPCCTAENC